VVRHRRNLRDLVINWHLLRSSGGTKLVAKRGTIGDYSHGKLKKIIQDNAAAGTTTPGGSDTQVQYNDSDSFGGVASLTYADDTGHLTIIDDKKLYFGTGGDASFEYDEDGSDTLLYAGSSIRISDDTKLEFGTGGEASISYDENISDKLIISGAARGTFFSGSSTHVGYLGSTPGAYKPTIATPITALDVITDCTVVGGAVGDPIQAISDGQGGGDMIKLGSFDSSVTVKGHIVMLNNGVWYAADRSDTSGASAGHGILAAALDVYHGPDDGLVLLRGIVRIDGTLMNGFTNASTDIGRPVYLSTTAGEYDMAVSSTSGDIVRVVGHMLDTDGTDHLIYFNPSNDWVEIS